MTIYTFMHTNKERDMDHIEGYSNLVYAVIHRAVQDTFLPPIANKKQIDPVARSAMIFLLGNDIDPWLELIDRDPAAFKRKLVESMFAKNSDMQESDQRNFQINHVFYDQEMAQQRKVHDFLKRQQEWTE